MNGNPSGKIYFASDFHLGAPDHASSVARERKITAWMDSIKPDCAELFLVGDLFDAWFEYKRVVPKGFTRLLGKISEFSDAGIPVHIFSGNHDMWMFGYVEEECGAKLYHAPITREWNGKKFFIGHGDGLGPGDGMYKFMKAGFRNKFLQWCYARLHPNFAVRLAQKISLRGFTKKEGELVYHGDEKELLMQFCKQKLKETHFDYFIFGHRHIPIDKECGPNSRYINLGDWIKPCSYAVFDGEKVELKNFKQ
ncbi:MAG TPA: UDP-2,3-diacylglucosamine diphosphatase [Bacteroidia bacterium]|jgi:UDP-2,3-diacylglucosamine hydrolase|nr:UDP-2,3-diacylglucosamine diphosphatase [Bacteroidia bacterium]